MTKPSGQIPHALSSAYDELLTALDTGIQQSKANLRSSNTHSVCRCIERFVDALVEIPGGMDVLHGRATMVENRCGSGSKYESTRAQSLSSHHVRPCQQTGSGWDLARLQKSTGTPLYLAEIATERKRLERVLSERIIGLSDAARTAYESWLEACRAVQREADPLCVDGCWYLFHIHESGEGVPSGRAEIAKGLVQSRLVTVTLVSIRAAAIALMAWAKENVTGPGLIERVIRGPVDKELTPSELALLEAYLAQPISIGAIQQDVLATDNSETRAMRDKLTQVRDFNHNLASILMPRQLAREDSTGEFVAPTKAKRSTVRGEGKAKLIAALTQHHEYTAGSCFNFTPINSNELARLAQVAHSTANSFFNTVFGSNKEAKNGYANYRRACNDQVMLNTALKMINNEFQLPGKVFFVGGDTDIAEDPDRRRDRRRKPKASDLRSDDEG